MNYVHRYRMQGLSLIELMIAILIGTFLTLGLVQVFSASREAYRLSEGLARVQENGRFALDYLQRDIRMAGHMGCVNDQARQQTADTFVSHTGGNLDFGVSIRGYDSGAVPAGLGLAPDPVDGSDIIVLRFLTADGLPITAIDTDAGTLTVNEGRWGVLTQGGVANPVLFGIADCAYADVFQAAGVAAGTGTVTVPAGVDLGRYGVNPEGGPATLYRAEAVAYYIAQGAGGQPSLWRMRFGGGAAVPEELVEGVENMQLRYGMDSSGDPAQPTGYIASQGNATTVGASTSDWLMVGQVQVALLMASPNPASAAQADEEGTRRPNLLGVQPETPNDRRYRTVYQSTIALRNRLYGN